MKKISLLLVVLLAAGSASLYGQMMANTEFKISGNATATVGYNIDDEQFGFKNESESNIKLELVPESSANNSEMVSMDGWHGSIELNKFKIVIDSDNEEADLAFVKPYKAPADGICADDGKTVYKKDDLITLACAGVAADTRGHTWTRLHVVEPEIVAKLKNGPLFLKIFAAPGNEAGLIDAIEDDSDTVLTAGDNAAESNDTDRDVHTDLGGSGVTLGYDSPDLSVALGVTSDEAYDDDTNTPDNNSFAISADLTVDVSAAKLQLQVVQGLAAAEDTDKKADDTGVAGKLTTTFGEVELNAGADLVMTGEANDPAEPEDESLQFEVGMGADVTLTENTMFGAKYLYSSVQSVASDVEVVLKDDSGLVDRLAMGLTWGLFDINNGDADALKATENDSMDMLVKGDLSYKLDAMGGTLTPGAELTLNQVDGGDATVGLTVKAVLTEAVPATEFGLQWKTAQLFDVGDMESQQGTVTAWAKITYG